MNQSVHARTQQKPVTLAENGEAPKAIQFMKAGVFSHPFYGIMRITSQTFSDMVTHWANDVRKQRLPIDYSHYSDEKAAGWITRVYSEGDSLWGEVEWTPAGKKAIEEKEFGYFSADFYFQWEDSETGLVYENVLNGGGLTNRPFLKGMKAVAQLHEGEDEAFILSETIEGDKMKTEAQYTAEIVQLGENVKAKDAENVKLAEKVKTLEGEVSALKGEKAKILAEKAAAEKLAKFEELCRTGKAVAAQKDAFLSDDLVTFAELAKTANVVDQGDAGGKAPAAKLSEEDKATCAALGLSEEDFIKYNK